MLTADLVQVREVKGEVRPRYIDAADPDHLELAGRLVAIFEAHRGRPRGELDEELRELLGTGTAFLLHRGLTKLLLDRCEFETVAPAEPADLRRAVFEAAAAAYRAPAGAGGMGPVGFERSQVLAAAARELEIEPETLAAGLYADLREEQVLTGFKRVEPDWLLKRYNVALAQGVLLRAEELIIRLGPQGAKRHRALFRKIKFFQLLHRVEADAGGGYTIHLDGPLSLFRAGGKYGVRMASFLPTLLHFQGWELEARLLWGRKRRRRSFRLSPETGLVPYGHLTGQWQPEEVSWLPEGFAKLDCDWEIETGGEVVDLGGQGILVPDFVFYHPESGTRVWMEVLGFWRRGAVDSRLALLRRSGPKNMILAISKQLATGRGELQDLPGQVYVFRSHPIARQVLEVLQGMREG